MKCPSAIAMTLCACCASAALAQPPLITHITPGACRRGETTVVTLHGQNLAGATALWTGFPATTKLAEGVPENGKAADRVAYEVSAPTAAPGIVGLRVATADGISNLQLLLIDDLPSVADDRRSRSPETSQSVTLPTAVDGACDPESSRWYKFTAKQGDRISAEVFARRLGSPLDPQIRLLDALGRELAFSDDELALARDCRLSTTIPKEGDYFIELRDVGYQGGAAYRYRMWLGNFHLRTTNFPLVAVNKLFHSEFAPVVVTPGHVVLDQLDAAPGDVVRYYDGEPKLISDLDEFFEKEPNSEPAQVTTVVIPCGANGSFDRPRDRDNFAFAAKAGERLAFAGQSRSLGSPSELFLQLFAADGKLIARSDDSRGNDGDFVATIPTDGEYRLAVEDLHRRGGPEFSYRVEIRPFQSSFALFVDRDRVSPPQGGVLAVKVTAARREYEGPITLTASGLGEGAVLADNAISEKANETTLKITMPSSLAAGSLRQLMITGVGMSGDRTIAARATTTTAIRRDIPALAVVPPGLERTIGVGVGPVFPPFYELAVEPAEPLLPQLVLANNFKIKAQRLNNFADQIDLAVAGLPPGVEAKVAPIAKGQAEATIALTAKGPIELGATPLQITASATFQNQPRTVVLEPALRVIRPLVVALKPAGPLAAGGKQTLKVQLTRFGANPAPVKITFKNLPQGVTAPGEASIPADKSEIDLEITASADAAASKNPTTIATASTMVMGEAVTVESAPVIIEVVN